MVAVAILIGVVGNAMIANGSIDALAPADSQRIIIAASTLLSQNGLGAQMMKEAVDFYLPMAEATGTLWENMTFSDSCNHGFAAHLAHVFYRDAAGLYKVDRVGRTLTLRLRDTGLKQCSATLPVKEGDIKIDWSCSDGKFNYDIKLPKGWKLIEE